MVPSPELCRRLRGQVKRKSSTWHMDETYVRIAGRWTHLFRAVDSGGQTVDFYLSETRDREAAKLFLKRALANADRRGSSRGTGCAAIRLPFASCKTRVTCIATAGNGPAATVIIGSNRIIAR